jgi:spermidine synthase
MAGAWRTLERVSTPEGVLELRQRAGDYLITIAGRVLMTSAARRSEEELARLACAPLAGAPPRRVLIAGLGLGYTLRAALDALPADAAVTVAEITPAVIDWGRGALAPLTGDALADPRVTVHAGDVAALIASAPGRWDVICLDLYEGPHAASQSAADPFYGAAALTRTRAALRTPGRLAVWSEDADAPFERRLARAGLQVAVQRAGGRGGRRHIIYLGTT